jgi:hypothetical protein
MALVMRVVAYVLSHLSFFQVYVSLNSFDAQKFTWEGPNDTKLLLLTQGRYVKTDEYENLAKAMGSVSPLIPLPAPHSPFQYQRPC